MSERSEVPIVTVSECSELPIVTVGEAQRRRHLVGRLEPVRQPMVPQ